CAVDIEVGFSEDSGSVQGSHRIAPEVEPILRAHLHDHFDGSELLIFIRNHANGDDIADVHAVEPHGRAHAQATCVVEVGNHGDAVGEVAARPGHQKQKQGQDQASEDYGEADPQLRPFELLLTRQIAPSD